MLYSINLKAQTMYLWVGETRRCEASSAVVGLTTNIGWNCDMPAISLSGVGLYRDVTINNYFKGTAIVKCTWQYKLYYNDTYKPANCTWYIACRDNPLVLSTSSLRLNSGGQGYITASLTYSNSYSSKARITYTSTNPSVASVSSDGLVTARQTGQAYITVYSSVSAEAKSCLVTVVENNVNYVSSVTVSPSVMRLGVGEKESLTASVLPSNARNKTVTWSSSDETCVTVSQTGEICAIKKGDATITATSNLTQTVSGTSIITVYEQPTKVSLSGEVLYKRISKTLKPQIFPEDAETTFSWTSSNPSVASIDDSGFITPLSPGETTITVHTKNGLETSAIFYVKELPTGLTKRDLKKRIQSIKALINETLN